MTAYRFHMQPYNPVKCDTIWCPAGGGRGGYTGIGGGGGVVFPVLGHCEDICNSWYGWQPGVISYSIPEGPEIWKISHIWNLSKTSENIIFVFLHPPNFFLRRQPGE
jgi:hypothetical protein